MLKNEFAKGRIIFSANAEECKTLKKDTYLWMGGIMLLMILWDLFNVIYYNMTSIFIPQSDIRVFLLVIFSFGSIWFIIFGLGFKINVFRIYENGLSPPTKPLKNIFQKDYFVPYSEIKFVNIKNGPMYYELLLRNGKIIPMRAWPLYKFINEKQHKKVEPLMKKIHDFIEVENEKELKGEKGDWSFKISTS